MFSLTPRFRGDFGQMCLYDELSDPWNCTVPLNFVDGTKGFSGRSGESEVQSTDKEFRIRLDLKHYKPEDVKISSDDQKISIHAKHDEQVDNHGLVSREMSRIYKLPEGVDPKSVTSAMSKGGVLNIKAEKTDSKGSKDTTIPIEYTGKQ